MALEHPQGAIVPEKYEGMYESVALVQFQVFWTLELTAEGGKHMKLNFDHWQIKK